MSVTLGFGLISLLCFLLTFLIIFEIGKIVSGRKQELDQVIKILQRDKAISDELQHIKNYMATIEYRLNSIEKVALEAEDNQSDLICNRKKHK
jgi:hypothetical protein